MAKFIQMVTAGADRWDLIAYRYYGDATRFSELIAANPSVPMHPVLPPGVTLYVPILAPDTTSPQNLPPWTLAQLQGA